VHINCVLSDPEKIAANLDMYRNFFVMLVWCASKACVVVPKMHRTNSFLAPQACAQLSGARIKNCVPEKIYPHRG
jgi:hypothetical protein